MFRGGVFALLLAISAGPVAADFSVFVASVGFDDEANLEGRSGFGVRWGQSSKIFGGETSLMIARPTRTLSSAGVPDETATAIFYEGRLIVNIPLGLPVKPFLGVGLGAITVTSTTLPDTSKLPRASSRTRAFSSRLSLSISPCPPGGSSNNPISGSLYLLLVLFFRAFSPPPDSAFKGADAPTCPTIFGASVRGSRLPDTRLSSPSLPEIAVSCSGCGSGV